MICRLTHMSLEIWTHWSTQERQQQLQSGNLLMMMMIMMMMMKRKMTMMKMMMTVMMMRTVMMIMIEGGRRHTTSILCATIQHTLLRCEKMFYPNISWIWRIHKHKQMYVKIRYTVHNTHVNITVIWFSVINRSGTLIMFFSFSLSIKVLGSGWGVRLGPAKSKV